MNENTLTRALVKRLRERLPGAVVLKHDDLRTAGIPDISVTWHGSTVWLEVKRGSRIVGTATQALTMDRLYGRGKAYYVLYSDLETSVINPPKAHDPEMRVYQRTSLRRHDHDMVVVFVARTLRGFAR